MKTFVHGLLYAVIISAPGIAHAQTDTATNLRTATLNGFRLGMSPAEALPIVQRQFGKAYVIKRVACLRDYAAALHTGKSEAEPRCIGQISAGNDSNVAWRGSWKAPSLQLAFVEDVASRAMKLTSIDYRNWIGPQSALDAFAAKLSKEYGAPTSVLSQNDPGHLSEGWCNGFVPDRMHGKSACTRYDPTADGVGGEAQGPQSVMADGLPRGVPRCPSPETDPNVLLFVDGQTNAMADIQLVDIQYGCQQSTAMQGLLKAQ